MKVPASKEQHPQQLLFKTGAIVRMTIEAIKFGSCCYAVLLGRLLNTGNVAQ